MCVSSCCPRVNQSGDETSWAGTPSAIRARSYTERLSTEHLPGKRRKCLVLRQGEASVLTQAEEAPERLLYAGRETWLSSFGSVGCIAHLLWP